eukprot:scaffold35956_cov59-Phaeocystis_antarctica.AAC.1
MPCTHHAIFRARAVHTPRTHRARAARGRLGLGLGLGLGSLLRCRPAEPTLAPPSQVDAGEPHGQGRARSGCRRVVSNGDSR